MTQQTPPGWYPDPGHTGEGPLLERWWDGTAWTDHTRMPGGYPVPPPASRGGGVARKAVAIGAAVVVLAAAVVGGVYLVNGDGGSRDQSARSGQSPTPSPSRPGGEDDGRGRPDADGERGQGLPGLEKGYATDIAGGISIPVPDGWTGQSGLTGAGVSTGSHACPGDSGQTCVRAGVSSVLAEGLKLKSRTAEAAAKEDIESNAEESYGGESYGSLSSHEQLKSEAVTVAGQKGYLVRWKVVTSKGDDGYVQSLVFPSPANEDLLVVVRSGFDINDKAPELSVMDEITEGIKAADVPGAGTGQEV
ncbi:DUF2510 domain-containing protein [Streptomyces sp. GC420]|uniref:DUF2510 domain-containing protein n=1 Tax=Streptomyces sp. GC420 TaxID=2697568 RepID=UPI0028BEA193|nr:DUF2510 domain-containing protein [Streptomyces sp. GC420]